MANRMKIEKRGALFYVVHSDGKVAGLGHRRLEEAEESLRSSEREAERTIRICMTCEKPFQSEGSHNRMCPRCRNRGG